MLGIQWLQTLSPLIHDYAHQSMEFQNGPNKIVLGNDSSEDNQGISFSQFQVLAHSTEVDQIFEIVFWPSPPDTEAQTFLNLESQEDVVVISLSKKDMLGHWWNDDLLGVSQRSIIFSLYALEDVYKDF